MITVKGNALPAAVKTLLRQLVHVWPNFNLFVPGHHTLERQIANYGGPLSYLGASMAYALLYSAILLTLASLIFRKRDFL
jgi:hypothetical protein